MHHTRTTTALLDGLADASDVESWRAFDARYRPILVSFGRHFGLAQEDAADAAQEALVRFVKSYRGGKYDRARGRLRSWLIGISRHCIQDLRARSVARREFRGMSAVDDAMVEGELERLWDLECKRAIIQEGFRDLRRHTRTNERTIRIFSMLTLEGKTVAEVSEEVGVSRNDVYLAKHRCLERLRTIITRLNEVYEVG